MVFEAGVPGGTRTFARSEAKSSPRFSVAIDGRREGDRAQDDLAKSASRVTPFGGICPTDCGWPRLLMDCRSTAKE